ncbi:MAG: sodium-translocating pyrophosphatase [Treponema sp.]|jgi:K(+)-stimulated pyrophosphate-energized sodium pump|nr:sodium-translocating pyrophosphatase [Treponema sp.]
MLHIILIITLCGSLAALLYAVLRSRWILKQPVENEDLRKISGFVADGAMAFLKREYSVLLPFVIIAAAFLFAGQRGAVRFQSLSFLLGAFCSGLAGFAGMVIATASNSRTTQAAQKGINPALRIAFSGGSVMGMSVVGLALLGVFLVLLAAIQAFGGTAGELAESVFPVLSGFSLGASCIALFARVGGGIFTKAADVGADLVGKVEAGIPEDDARNPAVIADSVGDNVGDVAGMGADLFESYVGSLIGSMILGLSVVPAASGSAGDLFRLKLAGLPLLLCVTGVVSSIIGIFFVKVREGRSPQRALNTGSIGAALIAAALAYPLIRFFLGTESMAGGIGAGRIYLAVIVGLLSGSLIGILTEFFTGTDTRPVRAIVHSSETGAATNIITGLGMGMMSCFPAVLLIVAAIMGSYGLAGFYGVGIGALGMLITLGIQLAVDAYGPIADNAGGLAVMAEFPHEVRTITDKLDAVGNTTAAIGKGFAIGSAALTAIILFTAFREQAGLQSIDLTSVPVLAGLLLGAVIPFLFSSLSMTAIGRAAFAMIEEVRRQFRERPGILQDTEEPDYKRCIGISTAAALKEMLLPGFIAIITPPLVGFTGGIEMLAGVLVGVTVSGVILATFMSNAGGAWDNAKKMIEGGASGGRGSDAHKASVVGDTVGDPFKDTAGPALNILIKLMAVISLVIAPMLKNFWR